MALADRDYPYPSFNFLVQLIEPGGLTRTVAGFSECSGLEATLTVQEYLEGGVNDRVHRFPSRFGFGNLVLKRGVTLDGTLRDWQLDLLQGRTVRRDGLIVLLDEARRPALAWRFERALPAKWSGPALNASSSAVSIETLELAVERIEPFGLEVLL
jgi:phage tail-like protein